jgi:hypothetical protein
MIWPGCDPFTQYHVDPESLQAVEYYESAIDRAEVTVRLTAVVHLLRVDGHEL